MLGTERSRAGTRRTSGAVDTANTAEADTAEADTKVDDTKVDTLKGRRRLVDDR